MKSLIHSVEDIFERIVNKAVSILGHSITFFAALVFVVYWLFDEDFYRQSRHDFLRDLMYAITFLSFFMIQKSVNRFSKAIQIKLNELVSAHENARTHLVNIENKPERELEKLAKDYNSIAEKALQKDSDQPRTDQQ